jgi:hypothetical protein
MTRRRSDIQDPLGVFPALALSYTDTHTRPGWMQRVRTFCDEAQFGVLHYATVIIVASKVEPPA